MLIYLDLFGRFICRNVCQEVGPQSIETVKLWFLYLFWGDFLEIFYSIFKQVCTKSFIFVSSFNFSVTLLRFHSQLSRLQSKFRGKKRKIKNTKLYPKTMKDFSQNFPYCSRFQQEFFKVKTNLTGFYVKKVAKSILMEIEIVSISSNCICGSEDCSTN